MKKYIILSFIFFFSGCSILGTTSYTYPILKPMEGLSVLEKGGGVESCILNQYGIERVYKLEKKDFVLYVIIGNKWFPKLYLGAKDKDGNLLEVKSAEQKNNIVLHPLHINDTIPFNKRRELYGINKAYSVRQQQNSKIKLYLHDSKGTKVGEVVLKFDFKSNKCVSVGFI